MQIKGVEGLTPELIRDEVNRGARLVIYTYCVSLLVVTLKRPTAIYFVRPGQSPAMRGLPFTLTTLLFGWWGFPWGPIYSIECLYKNLRGGVDVTDGVLAALLPATPAAPEGPLTAQPARQPAPKFSRRQILVGAAIFATVLLGGYALLCQSEGDNLKIAVISGLPERYTVSINGESLVLQPGAYVFITKPEGNITVGGAPGRATETTRFERPFWSRPFNDRIAVINPDHSAVFYRYHVIYKADSASGDDSDQPTDTAFYANQLGYLLPVPDYAFEEAPRRASMPSGARFTSKSRLALMPVRDPERLLSVVSEQLGAPALLEFARNLTRGQPDSETVLFAVQQSLKPADMLALLETRLDERPVRVDWHRAYQNLAGVLHPETDLPARYASLAKDAPDNGALQYLQARIETDSRQARTGYERALAAQQPCAHAHLGLGFLESSAGRFDAALQHYLLAEKAGLKNESVESAKRDALFALRRYDDLLADVRQRQTGGPLNLQLAAEQIRITAVATADPSPARKLVDSFCARFGAEASAEEKPQIRAYLESVASYALGNEADYVRSTKILKGPFYAFDAAVSERDHRAAALALTNAMPHPTSDYLLILYLVARQNNDTAAADEDWKQAVQTMQTEGRTIKQVARQLVGEQPLDPDALCALPINAGQKCVLLASLGLRYPAYKAQFHSCAALNNFNPTFPSLLIDAITRTSPTLAKSL